jgi:hypothetical protein
MKLDSNGLMCKSERSTLFIMVRRWLRAMVRFPEAPRMKARLQAVGFMSDGDVRRVWCVDGPPPPT